MLSLYAPLRPAPRLHQPERMDDPQLSPDLHQQALAGLARLNTVGRSAAILWDALRPYRTSSGVLSVLDIACGGGDVTTALAKKAARHGLNWRFCGLDKSSVALALAQQTAHRSEVEITWQACDVLAEPLPEGFDVVICSLFLHHLEANDATALLRKAAAAASRGLMVSDLCRSRTNLLLTWLGCHLLTRSPVVHFDGPVSAQAAFTKHEALELAHQAGLADAKVESRFPARWLLHWRRR